MGPTDVGGHKASRKASKTQADSVYELGFQQLKNSPYTLYVVLVGLQSLLATRQFTQRLLKEVLARMQTLLDGDQRPFQLPVPCRRLTQEIAEEIKYILSAGYSHKL